MEPRVPRIGITMGDPAGIGPELVVRIVTDPVFRSQCRMVVVGHPDVIRRATEAVGVEAPVSEIHDAQEATEPAADGDESPEGPEIPVLVPTGLRMGAHRWGVLEADFGGAAALCLEQALRPDWGFQAVVSAPLNKEAFHKAGYEYADELAFLAERTGSRSTCIAGLAAGIWTVAVTEHVALGRVPSLLTIDGIVDRAKALDGILRTAGKGTPRIAVAALNPHAGEGGLMGTEEIDIVQPAVARALAEGLVVTGPVPADTVFVRASDGEFDGVVCLYHDQANIARKLLARRSGATILIGLPIPVTTTAHGTAFDIAGTGRASVGSMAVATRTAISLAGGSAGE